MQQSHGRALAFEGFSFDGSSGSPVFALPVGFEYGQGLEGPPGRDGALIGINAGHFEARGNFRAHAAISYMFKSTVILDLLQPPE